MMSVDDYSKTRGIYFILNVIALISVIIKFEKQPTLEWRREANARARPYARGMICVAWRMLERFIVRLSTTSIIIIVIIILVILIIIVIVSSDFIIIGLVAVFPDDDGNTLRWIRSHWDLQSRNAVAIYFLYFYTYCLYVFECPYVTNKISLRTKLISAPFSIFLENTGNFLRHTVVWLCSPLRRRVVFHRLYDSPFNYSSFAQRKFYFLQV